MSQLTGYMAVYAKVIEVCTTVHFPHKSVIVQYFWKIVVTAY